MFIVPTTRCGRTTGFRTNGDREDTEVVSLQHLKSAKTRAQVRVCWATGPLSGVDRFGMRGFWLKWTAFVETWLARVALEGTVI